MECFEFLSIRLCSCNSTKGKYFAMERQPTYFEFQNLEEATSSANSIFSTNIWKTEQRIEAFKDDNVWCKAIYGHVII